MRFRPFSRQGLCGIGLLTIPERSWVLAMAAWTASSGNVGLTLIYGALWAGIRAVMADGANECLSPRPTPCKYRLI